jgi:hypothetical protein
VVPPIAVVAVPTAVMPILVSIVEIFIAVLPVFANVVTIPLAIILSLVAVRLAVILSLVPIVIPRTQPVLQIIASFAGCAIRKLTWPLADARAVTRAVATQSIATTGPIAEPGQKRTTGSNPSANSRTRQCAAARTVGRQLTDARRASAGTATSTWASKSRTANTRSIGARSRR